MRPPLFALQDLLQTFRRRKVATLPELRAEVGCSTMTAWRLLRRHGYLTSYNDNARHYTLVGIPQFDAHGLWTYRKIRFSKWGSLTETVVGVVQESPAGMTAAQLQQLLGVRNLRPLLSGLIARQRLARQPGAAGNVYFSPQPKTQAQQRGRRQTDAEARRKARRLPPLEQIIGLLVEIIQRPGNSPRQWARRLRRQGLPLSTTDIQTVLEHYQIEPKKGLWKS